MFRIPVKISTTEVIKLNARLTSNVRQLATQTTSSAPPPPPPPSYDEQPRKSGRLGSKLFLALLGATAITGATLAYAKSNQDFRNILKEYVGWSDDAIALIYSEREMPGSWVVSQVKGLASSASDLMFGDSQSSSRADIDILAPIKPPHQIPKITEITNIKEEKMEKVKEEAFQDKVSEVQLVSEKDCEKKAKVSEPDNFIAILNAATVESIAAYKNAIDILKEYTAKVNVVMESCAEGGTGQGPWDELRRANKRKIEAECRVAVAMKKFDTCSGIKAERARADMAPLKRDYEKAKAAADVAARYWPQVEEARKHFVDELEALFPRADISTSKLDTRGGDSDALLLVTLRRVLLYQQLLAKQSCDLSQKVDDALKGTDEDVLRAKVEIELERERRELAVLFQKKIQIAKAVADRELAAQLKRQMEIFQIQLQDALDHRAEQVRIEERKMADERAAAEKATQGIRLSAVLGRLQGVDHALKARSDADKMARQAQLLWAASEALEGVLRGRGPKQPRVFLAHELDAIASAAADTDELVAAVLRGVPVAARERGVLSESCLRERFLKVEKVCRALALVPECGARLHVYVLSWLQGIILARPPPPPRCELKDEPTDFSKLDTYDILERAKYCVERGEWGQALRYIQLLKGASAVVARDWVEEMALHLEARQAASALLAHASASGLLHL